ncbi:hypothetical protein EDB89DRAFT_1906856 [Lactarius sanguifluus]|nr:hypothetical protein EDB89DRAFT_1906856 [Lactarius sanguifluus]
MGVIALLQVFSVETGNIISTLRSHISNLVPAGGVLGYFSYVYQSLLQHLDHARSSGLLHSTTAAERAPKGTVRLPLEALPSLWTDTLPCPVSKFTSQGYGPPRVRKDSVSLELPPAASKGSEVTPPGQISRTSFDLDTNGIRRFRELGSTDDLQILSYRFRDGDFLKENMAQALVLGVPGLFTLFGVFSGSSHYNGGSIYRYRGVNSAD